MTVRVKNQSVEQIPPIAFSWFDPYQEQFDTAVTKPIALQVMETQVVSANDVITAQSNTAAAGEDGGDGQSQDSASEATGSFVGANLAITTDPMQLLTSSSVWHLSRLLTISCYSLAVLLIVGSVVLRKRQNRDQAEISRKKRLRQLTHQLQRAGQLPTKEAAERVARLLRELLAEFEVKNRSEIDALIARCDNMIYATGDAAAADAAELADKAVELARCPLSSPVAFRSAKVIRNLTETRPFFNRSLPVTHSHDPPPADIAVRPSCLAWRDALHAGPALPRGPAQQGAERAWKRPSINMPRRWTVRTAINGCRCLLEPSSCSGK